MSSAYIKSKKAVRTLLTSSRASAFSWWLIRLRDKSPGLTRRPSGAPQSWPEFPPPLPPPLREPQLKVLPLCNVARLRCMRCNSCTPSAPCTGRRPTRLNPRSTKVHEGKPFVVLGVFYGLRNRLAVHLLACFFPASFLLSQPPSTPTAAFTTRSSNRTSSAPRPRRSQARSR